MNASVFHVNTLLDLVHFIIIRILIFYYYAIQQQKRDDSIKLRNYVLSEL